MTPSIDVSGLGEFIREQRQAAQMSLRQLSTTAGVSNPYLSQVERGLRRPSAEILNRIARALSISAETLYVRAGILDERSGDEAVTSALLSDTSLTESQRAALLEIYASFQAENASRRAQPDAAPETNGAAPTGHAAEAQLDSSASRVHREAAAS